MRKPVWEVNENGDTIEHYMFNDNEIEDARAEGKVIIDFPWDVPLFVPKFDFETNEWVEKLTPEEIQAALNAPLPVSEIDELREENAQLNLAIIDLYEMILGGV